MGSQTTPQETKVFLLLPLVISALYLVQLLLLANPFWYCVSSIIFVLFTAEHIFNFFGRAKVSFFKKYSNSKIRHMVSFGTPILVSLITWIAASAL